MTERDQNRRELNEKIQEQIRSIAHESQCYLEYLDALAGSRSSTPEATIDRFQQDILPFLHDDDYPPSSPRPGGLTYAEVYDAIKDKYFRQDRHAVLTALFAAEIENHSRHELTTNQICELGAALERIGNALLRIQLPQHAAFAFERARRRYLEVNDLDARIRCLYGLAQAKRLDSKRLSWRWCYFTALWATTGYGFRPWRLLPLIIIQILTLATVHAVYTGKPFVTSCYLTAVNYVDLSFVGPLNPESAILVIDGYTGVLTTSVFFALLIKHWFR